MARGRLASERGLKISEYKYVGGVTLGYTIDMNPNAALLFRKSSRNAFCRELAEEGVKYWRSNFLGIRFTDVAWAAPFNYQAKKHTDKRSDGTLRDPTPPLVSKRRVMTNRNKSINRAFHGKITVRAKGDRLVSATLGLPMGHPITLEIARMLRVVPPHEIEAMCRHISGQASDIIAGRIAIKESIGTEKRVKAAAQRALARAIKDADPKYQKAFKKAFDKRRLTISRERRRRRMLRSR